jgi:hypothetical protein
VFEVFAGSARGCGAGLARWGKAMRYLLAIAIVLLGGCAGTPNNKPTSKEPAPIKLRNQRQVGRWQEEARIEAARTHVEGNLVR